MAKDNRTILRTPRGPNGLIKDEDELAKLLTPDQGQALLDSGAISGDWHFTGGVKVEGQVEAKPEKPAKQS